MSNQGNQGNRDREGNLGQPNRQTQTPTGTSGRQGENWVQGQPDTNRKPNRPDEDEPGIGNRNTNR